MTTVGTTGGATPKGVVPVVAVVPVVTGGLLGGVGPAGGCTPNGVVPVVTGGLVGAVGTTGGGTPNGVVPVVTGGLPASVGTAGKSGYKGKTGYVMGASNPGPPIPRPGAPVFDPGRFPGNIPGLGGGTPVGRPGGPGPGGAGPGGASVVPPGCWPGLWTLLVGGVGIPNMLVPVGVT